MPFLVNNSKGISVPIGGTAGAGFEKAPDGNEYFAILGPSINLVTSIRNILEAQRIYLSYPEGLGRPQAEALAVIAAELETAVQISGASTARFAEDRAKSLLERRIVRPATDNPQHLKDSIVAREIGNAGGQSWGAVGIGDISLLDAHVYWKAIEFGSTHLVGKEIKGFFFDQQGNRSAPSPDRYRLDPMFQAASQGPTMRVQNPIQGKHFLTDATFEALEYRFGIWRGIERASVAQVRSVRVATAGELAGTAFSATVGGFSRLARYRP